LPPAACWTSRSTAVAARSRAPSRSPTPGSRAEVRSHRAQHDAGQLLDGRRHEFDVGRCAVLDHQLNSSTTAWSSLTTTHCARRVTRTVQKPRQNGPSQAGEIAAQRKK
jgi:hypothetical protein